MTAARFLSLAAALLLAATPLFAAPHAKKTAETETALFIGNSYTFVNDLPAVVAAMAKAGKCPLQCESYTEGATALIQFWEEPKHARARQLVQGGGYAYVILQDQSMTPCTNPPWTLNFGGKWAELAKKHHAKPVFFLTWAHLAPDGKTFDSGMQDELSATYRRVAQEHDALVAPVGEAWRRWYNRHPDMPLHVADGSHPNALGTYLAGCVFYRVLCGKSAVGLPCRLRDGRRTLLAVPADKAKECQQLADFVAKAEKKRAAAAASEEE